MALLSRKKEEDPLRSEQVLLDISLMQNLQDRFCDANNLYLMCLDRDRTEVTKTYGSKEELAVGLQFYEFLSENQMRFPFVHCDRHGQTCRAVRTAAKQQD